MNYQSVLITGGAGFVGSTIAVRLKQRSGSIEVIAADNLKRRGSELNIQRLRENGIRFIHCDMRSPWDIDQVGAFDLLIDCAADASVLAGSDGSPRYVVDTNLMGTVNVLEAARRHHADVIFLSTSRVYPIKFLQSLPLIGHETRFDLPSEFDKQGISWEGVNEQAPLHGARSLYGTTKLASEMILQEYAHMYGVRSIINRCGVIAGAWQMGKVDQGFVALWLARHLWPGVLQYIGYGGKGLQVRDILHPDDLFDLIVLQLETFQQHVGQMYTVGGGRANSISLQELTALCQQATGHRIEITPHPLTRPLDIPWYVTDYRVVTERTGWKPKRTIEHILGEMIEWLTHNKERLYLFFS